MFSKPVLVTYFKWLWIDARWRDLVFPQVDPLQVGNAIERSSRDGFDFIACNFTMHDKLSKCV